jgi:hypothetical protein
MSECKACDESCDGTCRDPDCKRIEAECEYWGRYFGNRANRAPDESSKEYREQMIDAGRARLLR